MVRAPGYRPTLVDPYREHLRTRRANDPAVPITTLLQEIKALGYNGSANLLARYITQGRVESDHSALSPRRAAALLLTNPDHLRKHQPQLRAKLAAACPQMTDLADLVAAFATMLTPEPSNTMKLNDWINKVRSADLPFLNSFTNGIEKDRAAVETALTLPYHNGRTEGVNGLIKLLKRRTYGRAGFELLRHRILLSSTDRQ
ncbi:transposase [Actinocrinis puniceicyclus]|uniref:Transposase n=1 Tax=Actinocrinis puniceicyclus TaxID=977794 RepID=A0A8J7WVX2_9ACTN|nr:transposase [Actinocrinis puniceicyclus]